MKLERQTKTLDNGKEVTYYHCLGNGACTCRECARKGKVYDCWTDWFYKLTEDGECLCYDCLIEKLSRGE